MYAKVPLRHRLPNPPPIVVGRERERRSLAQAVERGPVSVVWGIGGIGKTTLALDVLHRCFAKELSRSLSVSVRPGASAYEAYLGLAQALVAAHELNVSWSGALQDPESLLALAIDLASEGRNYVLVEDLHHLPEATAREMLLHLHSYSRAARWVVTSRADPALPELLGQLVQLQAMPEEDCRALAHMWMPELPEAAIDRAVRASAGSPWRLRQAVAGCDLDQAGLLEALTPEARVLALRLAMLDRPLPSEALGRSTAAFAELERRGLVDVSSEGARLHDVARAGCSEVAEREGVGAELVEVLLASGDPRARLEAVRLLLAAGDLVRSPQLIEEALPQWFELGLTPRLWEIVRPVSASELDGIKLSCAVELGSGPALEWAAARPRPTDLRPRLDWVSARVLAKADAVTLDEAISLSNDASSLADVATEARFIAVRALIMMREPSRALQLLSDAPREQAAYANALRAWALATMGRATETVEVVAALQEQLDAIEPRTRARVVLFSALALIAAGRLRDLRALMEIARRDMSAAALAHFHSRTTLAGLALSAVSAGELDEAEILLQRLGAGSQNNPLERMAYRLIDVRYRMAAGLLSDLGDRLRETHDAALGELSQWASIVHQYAETFLGLELPARPAIEIVGSVEPYARAFDRLRALRNGHDLDVPAPPDLQAPRLVHDIVACFGMLLAGDADAAAALAGEVAARARAQDEVLLEADALIARCDALAVSGASQALADSADALAELGRRCPSRRFAEEALQYAMVAANAFDPELLERQAGTLADVAPTCCRRARRWLDETAPADAIIRVVVDAVRGRVAQTITSIGATEAGRWQAGWGLDAIQKSVWLPDGRTLTISDVAWRLLFAIFESGGVTSKEDLAARVWNIRDYHALRDANRVQVAVRRLRERLEDDPATPRRLLTDGEGYAFGKSEPVRLLATTSHRVDPTPRHPPE